MDDQGRRIAGKIYANTVEPINQNTAATKRGRLYLQSPPVCRRDAQDGGVWMCVLKLILRNVKSKAGSDSNKLSGMLDIVRLHADQPGDQRTVCAMSGAVAAKEPERKISACTGAVPRSRRVISPIRTAPAV